MREIKFRAWDKVFKSWDEWDHIKQCNLADYIEDERFEVVQYTGLKDRNGKEIYEGDIVKQTLIFTNETNLIGIVKFVDGSYVIEQNEINGDYLFSEDKELEVIGNMYENMA